MTIPIVMHEAHSYLFGIRTYHYSQTYYSLIYFCQRTSYLAVIYFTLTGKTKNARTHAESFLRLQFFLFFRHFQRRCTDTIYFLWQPKKKSQATFLSSRIPIFCVNLPQFTSNLYTMSQADEKEKKTVEQSSLVSNTLFFLRGQGGVLIFFYI